MSSLLKADLHIHTADDPLDLIRYSSQHIIQRAHNLGYDVLAITNHNVMTYTLELQEFAQQHGILLIPGVEASIERKHVLLFNMHYSPDKIKTFTDLREAKTEDCLVIAPHPFFPSPLALHGKLIENIDLFDGIEYCHFYFSWLNFNRQGIHFAQQHHLPMIGTSDAHFGWQFHTTYSMIRGEKTIPGVIQAIKEGKAAIVSTPLSLLSLGKMGLRLPYHLTLEFMGYLWKNLKKLPLLN